MTVYTKTGDKGKTSLFGGRRVLKSDPQVEAYGSLDELTSFLGLTASKLKDKTATVGFFRVKKDRELLTRIQKDLYEIMAFLAKTQHAAAQPVLAEKLESRVSDFEKNIDKLEKQLPKLNKFILPSGSEESAMFHVLRTVCRRAERAVVRFSTSRKLSAVSCQPILKYLNRLSDLFFMLARKYSQEEFTLGEKEWVS